MYPKNPDIRYFCIQINLKMASNNTRRNIRPILTVFSALAFFAAGCTGAGENKTNGDASTHTGDTVGDVIIRGQWYIDNIVFSDSDYVRPDEVVPGAAQYIVFEDSTYYIMTNCNSISGTYRLEGTSITLGDGAMTEMACDNMESEDALRRILPHIATIDLQNDTVLRLNGATPVECILLRKATPEIK